jgi:hypothetical protein
MHVIYWNIFFKYLRFIEYQLLKSVFFEQAFNIISDELVFLQMNVIKCFSFTKFQSSQFI